MAGHGGPNLILGAVWLCLLVSPRTESAEPSGAGQEAKAAGEAPVPAVLAGKDAYRVLVVGNSFTRNGDLYLANVLTKLAEAKDAPVRLQASAKYASNTDLVYHWKSGEKAVRKNKFDAVVLQEHSQKPLTKPEETLEYAGKFKAAAGESGGKVVLFMFWAHKKEPEKMEALEKAFTEFGAKLGVPVAPAGLAWKLALKEKPETTLYSKDGHHPAEAGYYLNACVLYAALTGRAPKGLGNGGVESVTPEMQTFLQDVAWRTVAAYQAKTAPAASAKPAK